LPLMLQHLGDAPFDGMLCDKARDKNGALLADTVRTVDCLVLNGRIPPAIKQENIIRRLQVEAHAAGPVAHQDETFSFIAFESVENRLSFARRNAAMEKKRTKFRQLARQRFQRRNPLRENDGLAAA